MEYGQEGRGVRNSCPPAILTAHTGEKYCLPRLYRLRSRATSVISSTVLNTVEDEV